MWRTHQQKHVHITSQRREDPLLGWDLSWVVWLFSAFPYSTCCCYLALDGVYHPLWAAFPSNPTWGRPVRASHSPWAAPGSQGTAALEMPPRGARSLAGGWSPADPTPPWPRQPTSTNQPRGLFRVNRSLLHSHHGEKAFQEKQTVCSKAHLLIIGWCFWPTEGCGCGEGREGGKLDRGQMTESLMCHIN